VSISRCNSTGHWEKQADCGVPCLLPDGPAAGNSGYVCLMSSGQATCISGGTCPAGG
jgi:hypothetical protein